MLTSGPSFLLTSAAGFFPARRGTACRPLVGRVGQALPLHTFGLPLPVWPDTSRLFVVIPELQASVHFAQNGLFLLFLRSDLCKYALKTHIICSTQKSHVLCFQVLLSFVPTVFAFLVGLCSECSAGTIPACFAARQTWRPPMTNCPQQDHNYRLSKGRRLVKRKMSKKRAKTARNLFERQAGKRIVFWHV